MADLTDAERQLVERLVTERCRALGALPFAEPVNPEHQRRIQEEQEAYVVRLRGRRQHDFVPFTGHSRTLAPGKASVTDHSEPISVSSDNLRDMEAMELACLRILAAREGFEVQDVAKDGHCFLRATGAGGFEEITRMRELTAVFVYTLPPESFVGGVEGRTETALKITSMDQPVTWYDEHTIYAWCLAYNRKVRIYYGSVDPLQGNGQRTSHTLAPPGYQSDEPDHHIGYLNGNHFVRFAPVTGEISAEKLLELEQDYRALSQKFGVVSDAFFGECPLKLPATHVEFIDVSFRLLSKTTFGKTYVHLIGKPNYDGDELKTQPKILMETWRKRTLCVLGECPFPIQDTRVQYVCCVRRCEVDRFFTKNGGMKKMKDIKDHQDVPLVNEYGDLQLVDFAFNHELENPETSNSCLTFYGRNDGVVCNFLLQQLVPNSAESVSLLKCSSPEDRIHDQRWAHIQFKELVGYLAIEFKDNKVVTSGDLKDQLIWATKRTEKARRGLREITKLGSPCAASRARAVLARILFAVVAGSSVVAPLDLDKLQKVVAERTATLHKLLQAEEQAATQAAIVDEQDGLILAELAPGEDPAALGRPAGRGDIEQALDDERARLTTSN
jgi:hypothetical protein